MTRIFVSCLVLGLVWRTQGEARGELILQIHKKNNDVINPVTNNVEEKVGTTFSLVCELISTADDNTQYDDQLSWAKVDKNLANQDRLLNESSTAQKENLINEINKAVKNLSPLQTEDKGNYCCVSLKFRKYKCVEIIVRDDVKRPMEPRPMRDTVYCADFRFKCFSSDVCIAKHYVCDGKQDCKDGSDESVEQCGIEACRGKIKCDDDRCIPEGWCCDRHYDPNCTVVNRPRCCQYRSDSYEELELGLPNIPQTQHSGARYLFISVCIVSILFSMVLLLLIVSRVVIFAKKTALQQQRHNLCESIAMRNQTNVNIIPCDFYSYRHSGTPNRANIVRNIIIDSSDVNDPLLFNPARFNIINASNMTFDQPPSYVDVLRNNRLVNEPPPPYRSSEMLDLTVVTGGNRNDRRRGSDSGGNSTG